MSEQDHNLWANDLRDKYGIANPVDLTLDDDEEYMVEIGDETEF